MEFFVLINKYLVQNKVYILIKYDVKYTCEDINRKLLVKKVHKYLLVTF